MKQILDPIYIKVGGMNDEPKKSNRLDTVKRKVMIASWACKFDVGDCVDKSINYFKEWMDQPDPASNNP